MDKKQEMVMDEAIRRTMTAVRNDAIVAGMKSALGAVLGLCNKGKSAEETVAEIRQFCERSLNGGTIVDKK